MKTSQKTWVSLGLAGSTLVGALALGHSLFFTGCGTGVSAGTTAQISFNDTTIASSFDLYRLFNLLPSALATVGTDEPYYFGIKFLSAYLAQDVDATQGNVGQVEKIYVNPACPDDPGCASTDQVTSFFNFARTSAEVNTELNGQNRVVNPGTFKYVRLDFCIGGGNNNWKFQETSSADPTLKSSNSCGVTSQAMSPALEIKQGDKVVINLNYTLVGTLTSCAPSGSGGCSAGGKTVSFPTLTPTVRKL